MPPRLQRYGNPVRVGVNVGCVGVGLILRPEGVSPWSRSVGVRCHARGSRRWNVIYVPWGALSRSAAPELHSRYVKLQSGNVNYTRATWIALLGVGNRLRCTRKWTPRNTTWTLGYVFSTPMKAN